MLGNLAQWLQVPVKIYNPPGFTFEGDFTAEPEPIETKCFLEHRTEMIINRQGQMVESMSRVYLSEAMQEKVTYDSLVELPDGIKYTIQKMYGDYDRFGKLSLVRLYL